MHVLLLSLLVLTVAGISPSRGENSPEDGEDTQTGDDDDSAAEEPAQPDPPPPPPPTPDSPPPVAVEESVEIAAPREVTTITEKISERPAIATFPAPSADELLKLVQGLHLSAHGGKGKAFQYFVRGFDAVHGSDLAVSVEGIPVNEVANVHGQGYLDLHFLPTRLVSALEVVKGSPRADRGDFAVAASAEYRLGLEREGLVLGAGLGTDLSGTAHLAFRPVGASPNTYAVGEVALGKGVGERRAFHQERVAVGAAAAVNGASAKAFAFGYNGVFESPGTLRESDIDDGSVEFYGAYPQAGGGISQRVLAGVTAEQITSRGSIQGLLWGGIRHLELRQNFTGYYFDDLHGDARLQTQQTVNGGAKIASQVAIPLLGDLTVLRAGLEVRVDRAFQGEWGIDTHDLPYQQTVSAVVLQSDAAIWGEGDLGLGDKVRLRPGIRLDHLRLSQWRRIDDDGEQVESPTWATSTALFPSPKMAVSLLPLPGLAVMGDYGRGFRSPEVRGIEDDNEAPVTFADTAQAGLRFFRWRPLEIRVVGFYTRIGNEIIFDHAAARFLATGATRRWGVEGSATVHPRPWLRLEGEVTFADGRYQDTGELIPYAPRWLGSLGIFVEEASPGKKVGSSSVRLSFGLRAWFLGARPLPGGFASHPTAVVNLTATLALKRWELGIAVDNLLQSHWRDGEFFFPSWWNKEEPRSELPVLHITAGAPFALRLTASARM